MMMEIQPASNHTEINCDSDGANERVPLQLCQTGEQTVSSQPDSIKEASDTVYLESPPADASPDEQERARCIRQPLVQPASGRVVYWMREEKGPWRPIGDTASGREWAIKRGAMFLSWASLSHEPKEGMPEPHRWGDFPFDFDAEDDPDKALIDLRKLIASLDDEYHLNLSAHECFASGGKGFHDIIPAEFFGAEDGDPHLPLIYKRIATTWKAEFELGTMDLSLYNMKKGKLLRVANVQRSNGRYKVPLTPAEVSCLPIEKLMELTTAPREIIRFPVELKPNEGLARLYQETKELIHKEHAEGVKNTPLSEEEREKLKEKYGIAGGAPLTEEQSAKLRDSLPPCIKAILGTEDKPAGSNFNFNRLLLVLVKFFQEAGFGYDDAHTTSAGFIERYPSNSYPSPQERAKGFRAMWDYLHGNDSYHFACSYVRGLKLPKGSFSCGECFINDTRTKGMVRPVVDDLNQRHAVIFSGKCYVLTEYHNEQTSRPDITIGSKHDLRDFYVNKKVGIPNKDGKAKFVNPVDLWMDSPRRREFKQIVFEPGKDLPNCYNLWRGFAVEPRKGDWSLYRQHIHEVICCGNDEHSSYLLAWMAHTVQHPGGDKPGISAVLRGKQGTGKGIFAHGFGRIFGNHYRQVTNQRHFTGNFNNHLKDCLVLFADEAFWAGSKSEEGSLKSLITEPYLAIEPKGKDVYQVRNHIRLIIASNNSWVIPAGLEERRFFVLDVSDKHQQDHNYFDAILKQMKSGGTEALLYDLLAMDISNVNLWRPPRTEALFEQIQHSMDPFTAFWFDCLREGRIDPSHDTWEQIVSRDRLYAIYRDYASIRGAKYYLDKQAVGTRLHKICPGVRDTRPTAGGGARTRFYKFPPLDVLSPKKNGPRYERLGGSGELIFSVMPAAVFEPPAAHSVIG